MQTGITLIVNTMSGGQPLERLVIELVIDQCRARGIELGRRPQLLGFGHGDKNAATDLPLRDTPTRKLRLSALPLGLAKHAGYSVGPTWAKSRSCAAGERLATRRLYIPPGIRGTFRRSFSRRAGAVWQAAGSAVTPCNRGSLLSLQAVGSPAARSVHERKG